MGMMPQWKVVREAGDDPDEYIRLSGGNPYGTGRQETDIHGRPTGRARIRGVTPLVRMAALDAHRGRQVAQPDRETERRQTMKDTIDREKAAADYAARISQPKEQSEDDREVSEVAKGLGQSSAYVRAQREKFGQNWGRKSPLPNPERPQPGERMIEAGGAKFKDFGGTVHDDDTGTNMSWEEWLKRKRKPADNSIVREGEGPGYDD